VGESRVVTSPGEAVRRSAGGDDVVLLTPDVDALAEVVAAGRSAPGRVAGLIGDPSSEADVRAAEAMARDLFGEASGQGS
jgi:NAD(P)-dependent dehydrogenase (short-subunit alcohol dehydrogenase family)